MKLANLFKRTADLFRSFLSAAKPAPEANHKFVLLTGTGLSRAQKQIDGTAAKARDYDVEEVNALGLNAAERKNCHSFTTGNTTYILWDKAQPLPEKLAKGIRLQKDLGDMSGGVLNLTKKGFTATGKAQAASKLTPEEAEAKFGNSIPVLDQALNAVLAEGDRKYAVADDNPVLDNVSTYSANDELPEVREISLEEANDLAFADTVRDPIELEMVPVAETDESAPTNVFKAAFADAEMRTKEMNETAARLRETVKSRRETLLPYGGNVKIG